MIISALHKFIFVAIPKTGTHSVRQALRQHMGPRDMEQVGLFVKRQFPIPDLARLQHGHLSLQQVRPYFPPEEFKALFKFAFVRNPFDRFISYCAFMTRAEGQFERNPQGVMRHFIDNPPPRHVLFQPQRIRENHHTAVGIDDPRMRFCAGALTGGFIPFQAHRNPRIHAPAAALFRGMSMGHFVVFTYFRGHFPL